MKKFLLILLSLTLILSVSCLCFACGDKEAPPSPDESTDVGDNGNQDGDQGGDQGGDPAVTEPEDLAAFAAAAAAASASSVRCEIEVVFMGKTTTAVSRYTGSANVVEYEVYNELSLDEDRDLTRTETVDAVSGSNTIVLSGLSLKQANLSSYTIEGDVLTATVSDPSAFFGTPLEIQEAVVTMTMEDGVLTGITVVYTSDIGAAVTIEAVVVS